MDKSRLDRRLQLLLKCIELTIYQINLRIFLEPGPQGTVNRSLSVELFCCGIILVADQERRERNPDNKRDQMKTAFHCCAYFIAQSLHNIRTYIIIYTPAKL